MNPSQEKMIAEMGIGPVWKLRLNSVEEVVSTQVFLSLNLPANTSICHTCGYSLVNSSDVQYGQAVSANYLFIYEYPINSERAHGLSSPSEQLLNSILRELRIKIGVNAYVVGIVKAKPVKVLSRQLHGQEIEAIVCLSCLKKQIEIIRPTVIISLGVSDALSVLGLEVGLSLNALRGQLYRYDGIPLIVTYELSYVVQQPKEKSGLWSDLCLAMSAAKID